MALKGIYFSSPKLQMQYNAATQYKANGIMNNAFEHPERPHTPSFVGSYDSQPAAAPYVYHGEAPAKDPYGYDRDTPATASYVYHEEAPAKDPYGYDRDTPATAPYVYHEEAPAKDPYGYDRDTPATASYVYGRDMPRRATILSTSASTVGFLPPKKKKHRNRCGKSCVLLVLLACFIILSVVMIVLYLTRPFKTGQESANNNIHGSNQPTLTVSAAAPIDCPVRAKAVPLTTLPKRIEDTLTEFERTLETKITDDTVSILANVVYMDKVIWQRSFGKMSRSNPKAAELSGGTVFPIASVTKVLTALMLYKLYHEEKVKTLDDPFKKYMPTFAIKDPFNSHDITLREIVSHMSGLPREAPCFPEADGKIVCNWNNSVMLERIQNLSLIEQPGNKVSYSNLGFGLLGQGLAFSQNCSYEDWMKKNIFEPLEMHDSGFKLTPEMKRKIPVGYLKTLPREPVEWGWASPAGGLFTSIEDIAKLEIKLFNSTDEDDFLSPVITEEFLSPAFILDSEQFMGSPWEMFLLNGYLARIKNGYIYGYLSNIYLFPDLKLALNVFNTGELHCCFNMAGKLVRAFHEELTARDIEHQPTLSEEAAAPYLGEFYTHDVPTIRRVIIIRTGGKLFFNVDNHRFHLNHIRGTTFELIDRRKIKCLRMVVMGINHEKVYFVPPDNSTNFISPGFTVFGFNLQGKAKFYRKKNILS